MNRKGFTLVEILIVIAILGILALFVMMFMIAYSEVKAQDNKDVFKVEVDQAIGLSSSRATLKIDKVGISYKNEVMEKEQYIPWVAVIKWEGKYGGYGHPSSVHRNDEYSFLRLYVDYYAMPGRKDPTIQKEFWLSFRICCQKALGVEVFEKVRVYIPLKESLER